MLPLILFATLISVLQVTGTTDACYGGDVVLKPEGSVWRSQLWYGELALFGGKLPQAEEPSAISIISSQPVDACASLADWNQEKYKGAALH
jgi:hypothetical protein